MIIDILDKSGSYIPTQERLIDKVVYRISEIEVGKYEIRTTFSSFRDFTSQYDVVPKDRSIRIRDNANEDWTVINGNVIDITNEYIKYIDVEVTGLTISDMVGQSTPSCFVKLKMERIAVENQNALTLYSPFYPVSLTKELTIEFDCTNLLDNPIKAAYINVDQYIVGNPDVSLKVTNTVIGKGEEPINYNWVDIKNGDITMIPPIGTERVGKHTLRFKITVNKTSSSDIYRLYGILVDMVEDKLYKGDAAL